MIAPGCCTARLPRLVDPPNQPLAAVFRIDRDIDPVGVSPSGSWLRMNPLWLTSSNVWYAPVLLVDVSQLESRRRAVDLDPGCPSGKVAIWLSNCSWVTPRSSGSAALRSMTARNRTSAADEGRAPT
jgi:hypothetical protein